MKVVRGENPPVASSSRSHRLRMVILIEDNLDARARRSSRSLPSTTRLTSFPPYGVLSLAGLFAINSLLQSNEYQVLNHFQTTYEGQVSQFRVGTCIT